MLFEKPSLRTRTTFEIAARELGGQVIALQPDVALGRREPVADVARNLERWVHAVVIRTFSQRVLEEFAAATKRLHVINALTDEQHPCQALADFITLKERLGPLAGRTLAFVGDGNNIAASLAPAAAMLGVHCHIASPAGYELPASVVQLATTRRATRRAAAPLQQPGRGGRRRGCRLHRYVDVDGTGSRSRRAPQGVRAVPGERRVDDGRRARRAASCTAFRRTAAKK